MINAPHMTTIERDLYEAGHREDYRGFRIQPKRDFGRYGYWSSEHRANINAGWVVCYGSGSYRGCNAAPGATFAWTLKAARDMIDDMIDAGILGECNHPESEGSAYHFWKLNRLRHEKAPA